VSDIARQASGPRAVLRLAALALLGFALGAGPAAASQIDAAPLTSNAVEDQFPKVSGAEVSWLEAIGQDSEVRLFDGTDTILVTDNTAIFDIDAHLSEGRLVWKRSVDGLDCSIERRVSGGGTSTVDASMPCVSEIRVAGPHTIWTEDANGALDDVFVRTDGGAPAQLGEDDVSETSPRVGDVAGTPRAAWLTPTGGLWYWNGSSAPVEIVASGASELEMDGPRVVWVASDGNDDEIYLYDGSSLAPLTNNAYDDAQPSVSGSDVAWIGYPDTIAEGEVFLADPVVTQLTDDAFDDRDPQVSRGPAGASVAWIKDDGTEGGLGDEIWMFEGCESVRVTDNAVADTGPSLDGNFLAWVQGGGNQSEIWTAFVTCDSLCGNGVPDVPEQCDDGGNAAGDGCDENCVLEVCGNGVVQGGAGETCDDGNTVDDDRCGAGCLVECGDGDRDAGEECDDGNTVSGDTCSATCLEEMCGNGRIDFGDECDDGNTVPGDGCSSACTAEAPASKAHQRCINALNRLGARLAAVQHKVGLECLDDAAEGNTADLGLPATAQDCPANDPDGKVARAQGRTTSGEGQKCDAADLPGFAYTGAASVNAAGKAEGIALLADLFGPDLDAALILEATDPAAARCQQDVTKTSQALSNLLFKLAVKQKKKLIAGTGGALAVSNEALELALIGYLEADAKGKIGRKETRIAAKAGQRCAAVGLDAAFPGCAPSADPGALAGCAASAARCRFCRAFEAFDGLAMDCDAFDDGAANASCP
jgi:cysteine-rich repeat protein